MWSPRKQGLPALHCKTANLANTHKEIVHSTAVFTQALVSNLGHHPAAVTARVHLVTQNTPSQNAHTQPVLCSRDQQKLPWASLDTACPILLPPPLSVDLLAWLLKPHRSVTLCKLKNHLPPWGCEGDSIPLQDRIPSKRKQHWWHCSSPTRSKTPVPELSDPTVSQISRNKPEVAPPC